MKRTGAIERAIEPGDAAQLRGTVVPTIRDYRRRAAGRECAALIPLLPDLKLSAALRWDQYDDAAGSELSSYLSARYQPTRWLLLRASWGEGFRAGSMNNLYDGTALHLQTGFDLVKCRRYGDHTVSAYAHYVGGFSLPEAEFSIAPHAEFDLFYQWAAPRDGRILYASYRHTF